MMKRVLFLLCLLILLAGCQTRKAPETPNTMPPSVMYEGVLYRTTGKQLPAEVDDSAIVGHVTSTVHPSQLPTENGQANFDGLNTPFAITSDGFLVLLANEWVLFEPTA